MKNFKKAVALLMTVIVLFCSFTSLAFAKTEEEYVANAYICQKARLAYLSGHTWVYFENLTDHELTVGVYPLPAGQGVSVGTYGYSIADGRGLYYNVECYRYNHPQTTDFVCVKKSLTQQDLDQMSRMIRITGIWFYLLNCSFAAFNIWNSSFGEFMPYLIFPFLARLCILIYPQHESGFNLYNPSMDQIYKQKGYGSSAYLVPANPVVPSK